MFSNKCFETFFFFFLLFHFFSIPYKLCLYHRKKKGPNMLSSLIFIVADSSFLCSFQISSNYFFFLSQVSQTIHTFALQTLATKTLLTDLIGRLAVCGFDWFNRQTCCLFLTNIKGFLCGSFKNSVLNFILIMITFQEVFPELSLTCHNGGTEFLK